MAANYRGGRPVTNSTESFGIITLGPDGRLGVVKPGPNRTVEYHPVLTNSSGPTVLGQLPMDANSNEGRPVVDSAESFGIITLGSDGKLGVVKPGPNRTVEHHPLLANSSNPTILGQLPTDDRVSMHAAEVEWKPPGQIESKHSIFTYNIESATDRREKPKAIDPSKWMTDSPMVFPDLKVSSSKNYNDVCRMNSLNIAAFQHQTGWIGSPFAMQCGYANTKLMPRTMIKHFPSQITKDPRKKKESDFAFICHSTAEPYKDLWLLLTDFNPLTGAKGAGRSIVDVPLLPFPVSKYTEQKVKYIHHYGDAMRPWRSFIIAWTSLILGMLFLFLLAAIWYLLRAAKRLKQKIQHHKNNPNSSPNSSPNNYPNNNPNSPNNPSNPNNPNNPNNPYAPRQSEDVPRPRPVSENRV